MAWKMLRVAIEIIKSEADIIQVPFAALCAVLRGAIAVLETRRHDEDIISEEDLEGFRKIMTWFARRWSIGKEYLRQLEQLAR